MLFDVNVEKSGSSGKSSLNWQMLLNPNYLAVLENAILEIREHFGACMRYVDFVFDGNSKSQKPGTRARQSVRMYMPIDATHIDLANYMSSTARMVSCRSEIYQLAISHLEELVSDLAEIFRDNRAVAKV